MADPTFKDALGKIAAGIQDLSSLEVVTYQGKITIKKGSSGDPPKEFNAIINKAKAEVTACTHVALDGDTQVFYDNDITAPEREAHHNLVDIARKNRQAVVDLFKDTIIDLVK